MTQLVFGTPDLSALPFVVRCREARTGSPTRKSVFYTLATYCLDGGWCYPSVSRIAHGAEASIRQTNRELVRLRSLGLLEIVNDPGRGRTNRYRLRPGANPDTLTDYLRLKSVSVTEQTLTGCQTKRTREKKYVPTYGRDHERLRARAREAAARGVTPGRVINACPRCGRRHERHESCA